MKRVGFSVFINCAYEADVDELQNYLQSCVDDYEYPVKLGVERVEVLLPPPDDT